MKHIYTSDPQLNDAMNGVIESLKRLNRKLEISNERARLSYEKIGKVCKKWADEMQKRREAREAREAQEALKRETTTSQ